MSEQEDKLNMRLCPIIGWLSGALMILGIEKPEVAVIVIPTSIVLGILSYLAYRWRRLNW